MCILCCGIYIHISVIYVYIQYYYTFTAQASYLQWLEHTGVNAGVVAPCDDCSSEEIMLPVSVPFGNYYHSSLYVSENDNCVFTLQQFLIQLVSILP